MNSDYIFSIFLIATVIVSGCTQSNKTLKGDKAVITRVIDGDTVEADIRNHTVTVRLQGVDTPEVHVSNSPKEWECNLSAKHLREYGQKASEYVKEKVENKKVTIVYRGKGYYGRTLGTIKFNDTTLSEQLLKHGFAQTYTDSSYNEKSRYLQIESKVRRREKGVWGGC